MKIEIELKRGQAFNHTEYGLIYFVADSLIDEGAIFEDGGELYFVADDEAYKLERANPDLDITVI